MHVLIRTFLVLVAAFVAGQIIPPQFTIGGLLVSACTIAAIIDFALFTWSGRGLLSHLKNSES